MPDELAKQLKDAGFSHPEGWLTNDKDELVDDPAFYPTLEELIEAVGTLDLKIREDGAEVRKLHTGKWSTGVIKLKGATPSEAVARLWLALNSK